MSSEIVLFAVSIGLNFYYFGYKTLTAKYYANGVRAGAGEQTVSFSGGVSNPDISFTPTYCTPLGIDKGTVSWQWKVRDIQGSGSAECDIGSSGPHTIYTVLDTPTAPMSEPWTEALDISCYEAAGMTTAAGATFFFDENRKCMVLYNQSNGKLYKLALEEIDDTGVIESEAIYEDKFKFDRKTGEVVATQRPKSKYTIKDGYEFDRDTGKFYEMVEQDEDETAIIVRGDEVSKEQAGELRAK